METPTHVSDLIERSRLLKRFCTFLTKYPLLVVPLFLCLYGYGTIDVSDFRVLSAAPLELHVEPSRRFLHFSPLVFFLGYPITAAAGATWSFAIVMLGGFVFFVVALRRFVAVRYRSQQDVAMLMVFAAPLLIVLTQYIGKSDPFMVAFLLLLVASTNPLAQVALACLVVLSHLEIGLLVISSAMFLGIVPLRTAAAGAILGVLLILGYHQYLLPSPPQSRADIGVEFLSEAVGAVLSTPILHLVATFGPFWLCVLTARRLGWPWLVVFAGTILLASATLDFTRVFVLVGLPMIIAIVDSIIPRSDAIVPNQAMPRWFSALPLLAFLQVHLLSHYVFDSRMPQLIGRVLEYVRR